MGTVSPDNAAPAPDGFLPLPETGRVFTGGYPIRRTDVTPAGHVSNTMHWQAAEEVLAGLDRLPARAEVEYHFPILPGDRLRLAYRLAPGRADIWLLNDVRRLASARLTRDPGEPGTGGAPAAGNHG